MHLKTDLKISQFVLIWASSSTDDFVRSAKIVIDRMKNQGADQTNVTRVLKRAYGRHNALKKFNANVVEFVMSLQ